MYDLINNEDIKKVGKGVLYFQSLSDLVELLPDKYLTNLDVKNPERYAEYNRQNGYRILAVRIDNNDQFLRIEGGPFVPIVTYTSTKFKDTKSMCTAIIPIPDEQDEYWKTYGADSIVSSEDQVFIGDGFVNIAIGDYHTRFYYSDFFYYVLVLDTMYSVRKNALEKLMNIVYTN